MACGFRNFTHAKDYVYQHNLPGGGTVLYFAFCTLNFIQVFTCYKKWTRVIIFISNHYHPHTCTHTRRFERTDRECNQDPI